MSKKKITAFLILKLPIAYIAGVRFLKLNDSVSQTKVKLTRFSQNPFKSMFWAVQGMAAELSTGIVFLTEIQASKQKISMLVVKQEAIFLKKAVGKVIFSCEAVEEIKTAVQHAASSGEPVLLPVKSIGKDESGDVVSEFTFHWSLKKKSA